MIKKKHLFLALIMPLLLLVSCGTGETAFKVCVNGIGINCSDDTEETASNTENNDTGYSFNPDTDMSSESDNDNSPSQENSSSSEESSSSSSGNSSSSSSSSRGHR